MHHSSVNLVIFRLSLNDNDYYMLNLGVHHSRLHVRAKLCFVHHIHDIPSKRE
jgi:hypothetical protein